MATLPDLDTGTISMLAYWNCTDYGFTAPTEITPLVEWGAIREYSTYDNGVEGRARLSRSGGGGEDYYFRYKTDGWLLAWHDRDTSYGVGTSGEGPHLLVPNWASSTLPATTLAQVIGEMWALFPAGATADVAPADVTHSWLPDGAATTCSLGTVGVDVGTRAGTFTYAPETTLHEVVAFGSRGENTIHHVRFDGNNVAPSGTSGLGSRDVLADGLAPNPDTSYPLEVYVNEDFVGSHAEGGVITIWS